MMIAQAVKTYAMAVDDNGRIIGEVGTRRVSDAAGIEVDKRAQSYMEKHGEKDYSRAMYAVLDSDPELKRAYARQPVTDSPEPFAMTATEAGAQVDTLAQALCKTHGIQYSEAVREVLLDPDNRELSRCYQAVR